MMQAVKIEPEPEAVVGTSIIVKSVFNLPENTKIYWAGCRVYAKRPCGRDVVVSKVDIFCEGYLEKGEYWREKTLPISTRVPPTVKERDLNYRIRSEISMVKPGTSSEEEFFFAESPVILKAGPQNIGPPNPVDVSIKGIKLHIAQDHFQPGDTINIDYELEKFKDFKINLIKNANLSCHCPDYAPSCVHIKPNPPTVEKTVEASNLTTGTLQVDLPSFIENSHRYTWEPPEKTRWKETYGDHVSWVIAASGTLISGESVNFQIPIIIYHKQTPEDSELFSAKQIKESLLKKLIVPDNIQISNQDLDDKILNLTLKNKSKDTLNGVTVKITPIESEFFELPPNLSGVNEWPPNTEIQAYHRNIGENIKDFQILIEDNTGNAINKRIKL
ncbi:MAG: hypothetical protein ACTSQ8_03940 [Candidatus Helarchaeota archaeon]